MENSKGFLTPSATSGGGGARQIRFAHLAACVLFGACVWLNVSSQSLVIVKLVL